MSKRQKVDEELEFGDSDDVIRSLQSRLLKAESLIDQEGSKAINLDRENRELKAFILQYCNNSTTNGITSVYSDPLLGLELNHFREGYLKLVGTVDTKVLQITKQNEEMRKHMGDTYIQNLQNQLASKNDENLELKTLVTKSEKDKKKLQKEIDDLKAKIFMMER